jgi:hypothetical protein
MARVQERAPSGDQARSPLPKVLQELQQAVRRIRDSVDPFEPGIHCQFPGVFEGFFGEFLFAIKVTLSALMEAAGLEKSGIYQCRRIPFD